MADELKQLTQRIKNSADKRYALKDEAGVVQNVTISYEGGGTVSGSSGEGGGIVVNPRAIVVQDGITEAKIEELIQAHIDAIPNSQKENSIVYKWNETVPAIRGIFTKINEIDTGLRNGVISYADKKGWLFVASTDGGNTKVFDVNNNYNQIMSLPDISWDAIVTPDAKRLVAIRNSNLHIVDIYKLKDDESGYELENSIDVGDNIKELALDGLGTTLVAVRLHWVYIYELNEQGSWNKIKDYFIEQSDGCEISKDGNVILIEGKNYPEKIYEIRKENEIWGEPEEVITSPASNAGFGANKFELTLDKQVLYIGNHQDDAVANDAGRVYVFYYGDPDSTDPFGGGSLKHFWKLDGNLEDSVGNTDFNTTGTVTYEDAKYNQGAKLSNLGSLYINENVFKNDGSVNVWIKLTQYKDDTVIFATHNVDGTSQFVNTLYIMSDGKLQIAGREQSSDSFTRFKTFDETVPLNTLTMLTLTKTDNKIEVYKDGVFVGSVDKVSFDTNSFESIFGYNSNNENADGTIFDHAQIFDKALTQEEVTRLYNDGWYLKHTINPPTNDANQKFGVGIASNFDNSRVWVASMESHKLYEYQVGDIAILNENDPFGDGSQKHFWKLESDANDSVGGVNGTLTNITFENSMAKFTGTNNSSKIVLDSIVHYDNMSISFDIIQDDFIIGNNTADTMNSMILGMEDYNSDKSFMRFVNDSNGFGISGKQTEDPFVYIKNTGFTVNELHKVVVTISDTLETKLYIDGVYIGSKTLADIFSFKVFGEVFYPTNYSFDGKLGNVRVFDKVLTDDEITQLYNAQG
jgi:hypothetical protein